VLKLIENSEVCVAPYVDTLRSINENKNRGACKAPGEFSIKIVGYKGSRPKIKSLETKE
jgi:hypothetical protein